MTDVIRIDVPLNRDKVSFLKAGDNVLINGTIYTGIDAAQQKIVETLARGEGLGFDLCDQLMYFVDPTPTKPGQVIGSAGPKANGWIDEYTPKLLAQGMTGIIGKGLCSQSIVDAIKEHGAVFFGAIAGMGALIAKQIVSAKVIAFPELGPEAVHCIEVRDFPVVVIVDSRGNNLHESAKTEYRRIKD
ncbi:MAG: fumarate hydratase C-terminal domain-containing protein [Desulfitobacteriaceae bacterium]